MVDETMMVGRIIAADVSLQYVVQNGRYLGALALHDGRPAAQFAMQ
jgi:hypothetical protein